MRRPKRGPALFELLGDRGLRAGEQPGSADAPAGLVDSDQDSPALEAASCEVARPAPDETRPAVIALDGDRLHVSFTSVSAAGAAFALLAVLAVAVGLGFRQGRARGLADGFTAGRTSYAADTATEIELARQQPPATYLVGGLLDMGARSAGESPRLSVAGEIAAGSETQERWIAGYTYVVAQEFSAKNVSDVEPAQRFLAEHGVETVPLQLASGGARLMTTQGYDRKDPAQRKLADQLLEKVRAIGAQYFASGGRYKLEGYFKTLTGEG